MKKSEIIKTIQDVLVDSADFIRREPAAYVLACKVQDALDDLVKPPSDNTHSCSCHTRWPMTNEPCSLCVALGCTYFKEKENTELVCKWCGQPLREGFEKLEGILIADWQHTNGFYTCYDNETGQRRQGAPKEVKDGLGEDRQSSSDVAGESRPADL